MKRKLPDWLIGTTLLVFVVPTVMIAGMIGVSFVPPRISRSSAESKMLQSTVVPQLLAWAKSDSDELKLDSLTALHAFDHVCYVWQYRPYDMIEAEIGPVDRFFGTYGNSLPENVMAFIGVRGRSAHVAHVGSDARFSIGRGGMRTCADVRGGSLVKEAGRENEIVIAQFVQV